MTVRVFRILVTGSRDWSDPDAVESALCAASKCWAAGQIIVVHGAARGADTMADLAARRLGFEVERHPADWAQHGRRAGYVRNTEMVAAGADLCLAFILAGSRGASMTADLAEQAGIPTIRHTRSR